MHHRPFFAFLVLCASALPAQTALSTYYGGPGVSQMGEPLVSIGDADGDGRPDFLVGCRFNNQPRIDLFSSGTFALLGTVNVSQSHPAAAGDLNLDGRADFVVPDTSLRAYSGNGAAPLWTSPLPHNFLGACAIGDLDGDGRSELAAVVLLGNVNLMIVVRGSDGSQLAVSPPLLNGLATRILALGDLDGDGKQEVGCAGGNRVDVYRTSPPQYVRTIAYPSGSSAGFYTFAIGNVAGDAKKELLFCSGSIGAFSTTTGALVATYNTAAGNGFTVVGDLDSDGYDDLAYRDDNARFGYSANPSIAFASGATGSLLATWSAQAQMFGADLVEGVGDVDGDGFGDVLLGDNDAYPIGGSPGGWQLLSGKILAHVVSMPAPCGGGPFLPELGATRPILGQPMTLVGRDCPAGALGVAVFGLRPVVPTMIGFNGCDVWVGTDFSVLHLPPPGPTWAFSFTLPSAPQLAGLHIAMQAFYPGTSSPIGIDFSNGLWMRLGF